MIIVDVVQFHLKFAMGICESRFCQKSVPLKKKGLKGTMFSDALRKTGILADKNLSLSDHVCTPCATKIRKTGEGFNTKCGKSQVCPAD